MTVSERVALANAIAERLQGRVGNPNLKANSGNISGIEKGDARDIAAAKAGLGSGKTLEAAQKVIERGAPHLSALLVVLDHRQFLRRVDGDGVFLGRATALGVISGIGKNLVVLALLKTLFLNAPGVRSNENRLAQPTTRWLYLPKVVQVAKGASGKVLPE